MIKICPTCGKEFDTHDRRRKYCSPACGSEATARIQRDKLRRTREEARRWRELQAQKGATGDEKM